MRYKAVGKRKKKNKAAFFFLLRSSHSNSRKNILSNLYENTPNFSKIAQSAFPFNYKTGFVLRMVSSVLDWTCNIEQPVIHWVLQVISRNQTTQCSIAFTFTSPPSFSLSLLICTIKTSGAAWVAICKLLGSVAIENQ